VNELDEICEILFFLKGQVDIGFQINRKKYYSLRRNNHIIIGDLECTFDYDSEFIYRAFATCEGYSIRKEVWRDIMQLFPDISMQLKNRIIKAYFYQIKIKIMSQKTMTLSRLQNRHDVK